MLNEMNSSFLLDLNESFFVKHGLHYFAQQLKKTTNFPFKDHQQFPLLTDSLIRKEKHHVLIETPLSSHLHILFIEAFLQHFSHEHIPPSLKLAELIYLDHLPSLINKNEQKALEKEIDHLHAALHNQHKYLLFAISNHYLFSKKKKKFEDLFLQQQLEKLFYHPKCRFILLREAHDPEIKMNLKNDFITIKVTDINDSDIMTLLKQKRTELESFHHVLIPEETLTLAHVLAGRYLSVEHALQKASLLLDSSAARLNTLEKTDHHNANRPILTSPHLLQVLANWTNIPASHLALHKFKLNDFLQHIEKQVFGQEAALTLIGQMLQHTQIHLHKNSGPFAQFLLVGPDNTGKETTALALTEYLFKLNHMFYRAGMDAHKGLTSLLDLKLYQGAQNHYFSLKEVIQEKPYAVFFLKDIEHASISLIEDLTEILKTGFLHHEGKTYYFRQAIFLFSTTEGSLRLAEFTENLSSDEENEPLDLMALIMQEQNGSAKALDYSSQEVIRDILKDIGEILPATFCQELNIVPFLLPQKAAIQNIIHLKLKDLSKMLDTRFGVELGYAPEVIRYLSNDYPELDIDKVLSQLYATIEQAIFSQLENKNRPNQLFLQLNETGQSLRCDWLNISPLRHHAS